MKIAINGNIIDTKNIYKITKLEEKSINASKNLTDHFKFSIKSFNNQEIDIWINGDSLFERKPNYQWNDWYLEDYEFKFVLLKQKANEFRDSIIKVWSENQSEIPQFNLYL